MLGRYIQAYTLYSSVRPFGISTLLGAVDKDGPALYVIEPSGVFFVSLQSTNLHFTPNSHRRDIMGLRLARAASSPKQSWKS
jgi:hypothetical protein